MCGNVQYFHKFGEKIVAEIEKFGSVPVPIFNDFADVVKKPPQNLMLDIAAISKPLVFALESKRTWCLLNVPEEFKKLKCVFLLLFITAKDSFI